MANRISGITIEIDGNTTKLNKALSDVDKQLKTTKTALADVEKLLKFDPKNTELLSQKQKLLADAIQGTQERLATLKSAQTDALSTAEYDALQREIIATEQELKRLQGEYNNLDTAQGTTIKTAGEQMKDTGESIKAAGEKVQTFGNNMKSAGEKMKPVTDAIVSIGKAAVDAAKELDEGYDIIIKKTGATGKTLDELKESMDNVFSNLPTDAQTAGEAIGEVNTRFGLMGEELEDVTEDFIRFAKINDTDVSSSVDNVDKIMKQFGVDSKDVNLVLGLMTKAGQDTGISMEQLESQVMSNGATLKEMGLSLEGTVTLLANMDAAGVDSATALAALKKAQQNATKNGESFNSALKRGISSIKNAKTETEALQIATELFGKKGAAEMTQAIREGRFSLDDLSASMEDYGDVVKTTYEETISPWDQLKVATNNLKVAGADLASELIKSLQPAIDKAVKAVQDFTEWFKNLDPRVKQTIVLIAGIVAAISPLLIIGGTLISGIGAVIKGVGALISVGGSLVSMISGGGGIIAALGSLATAAGPYLVGGLIIVGIIAATALIIANWDKIAAGAKELGKGLAKVGEAIVDGTKAMVKGIGNGLEQLGKSTADAFKAVKDKAAAGLKTVQATVTAGFNTVKNGVTKAWNAVKTTTTSAWNAVKNGVSTAWNGIKTNVSNGINAVKTTVTNGMNTIKKTASDVWNNIKTTATNTWNSIKTTATNTWNSIKKTAGEAWDGIKSAASGAWKTIKEAGQGAFNGIKNTADNTWKAIKESCSKGMEAAKMAITDKWDAIKNATTGAWEGISGAAKKGIEAMKPVVTNAMGVVKGALKGDWDAVKSSGSEAWKALKNGASSAMQAVKNNVSNTFSGIKSKVTNAFSGIGTKISSPFTSALSKVKSVASGISNAFRNVHIQLPSIKLPHLSVTWEKIGNYFSIPKVRILWYKKAYDNPVMFTQPTVLQTAAGMKGFGDGRGGEVVLGMNKLKELVGSARSDNTTINVYASPGMNVNQLADAVQDRLAALQRQRERAYV